MDSLAQNKKILIDSLKSWKKPGQKLIVGIDGYSGVGKTTIIEGIEKEDKDILPINRDDFAIPRKEFWERFKNAKNEEEKISILVNETINVKELGAFIGEYKEKNKTVEWMLRNDKSGVKDDLRDFDFSKKVLLVEGIFLFRHDELSDLFDKKVFLKANQGVADERRRKREKEKWGDDYFPDTHPDSAYRLTKIGFNQYLKEFNPEKQADLVIELN